MGTTLVKRMLLPGLTIPDVTTNDWDNELTVTLARADSSPADDSETLIADGTLIPIVPPHSRLTGVRLDFKVIGATSVVNVYRWMLVKNPDGDVIVSDLSDSGGQFHHSAATPSGREQRKYIIAKGIFLTNPNTAVGSLRIPVSRGAMRRINPFRPDDTLVFHIAKDTAGTTSILHGMGQLYFRTA